MATVLCNFNVNNLFVRYRFDDVFPGDMSRRSAVTDPRFGYLPMYNPGAFELFNPAQRDLAARVMTRDGTVLPDIVLLQEVESLIALRAFNDGHLDGAYRNALVIDSRDLRQIDVGVLSTLPIEAVRSHVDDLDPRGTKDSPWLFSRDCLELAFTLGDGRPLTVLVNHFKSKFIDWRRANTEAKKEKAKKASDGKRKRQAEAVVKLLRERFYGDAWDRELFVVAGDLNDEPGSPTVAPLVVDAGLENALERITPEAERWTHWYRSENTVGALDYLLLSPALSAATAGQQPVIERRGISYQGILQSGLTGPRKTRYKRRDGDTKPISTDFGFPRFAEVTPRDYASDHCAVFLEVA
jgi:endonuclease/exonuclease/phosphatase family metal-dependent hydrolase